MGKQNLQLKRSIDRRPISSNSVFLDNFPVIFRVSYHQIVDKKNQSELAFYAFIFEFTFRNSLGFSSPRFEQPGIGAKKVSPKTVSF